VLDRGLLGGGVLGGVAVTGLPSESARPDGVRVGRRCVALASPL